MEKIGEYTSVLHRQRMCAYCGGTETIQWRRGPDGKGKTVSRFLRRSEIIQN